MTRKIQEEIRIMGLVSFLCLPKWFNGIMKHASADMGWLGLYSFCLRSCPYQCPGSPTHLNTACRHSSLGRNGESRRMGNSALHLIDLTIMCMDIFSFYTHFQPMLLLFWPQLTPQECIRTYCIIYYIYIIHV